MAVDSRQTGRGTPRRTVAYSRGKQSVGAVWAVLGWFWWFPMVVEVMGELGGARGGSGWLKNG